MSESALKEIDTVKVNFGREHYRMNVFIRNQPRHRRGRARVECRIIHNGIDDRGKTQSQRQDTTLDFEWTGRTWVRVR